MEIDAEMMPMSGSSMVDIAHLDPGCDAVPSAHRWPQQIPLSLIGERGGLVRRRNATKQG